MNRLRQLQQLVVRSRLPVTAEELGRWYARPGAADRLAPPWQTEARAPQGQHTQIVIADGGGSLLEDRIEHTPDRALHEQIARVFVFRHRQLRRDLARHARLGGRPLTVAITGASGMIGRTLRAFLTSGGHRVKRLVRPERGPAGADDVAWDPQTGSIDQAALEGVDVVVNLAGETVAGRWTEARKRRIRDSRVKGTELLARALARLERKPRLLLSGSGVDFYRHQASGTVDENGAPGEGFLAEMAAAWERAAAPAAEAGIRLCHPRFGNVLDPRGGALAKLLPVFRTGLGGRLGSGKQPFSWVALDDAIGALHHQMGPAGVTGPFNVVAPELTSNAVFTAALAGVLGRPALLPVPAFALNLAAGKLAAALLNGRWVVPAALTSSGFRFEHPRLVPALAELMGKAALPPETEGTLELGEER